MERDFANQVSEIRERFLSYQLKLKTVLSAVVEAGNIDVAQEFRQTLLVSEKDMQRELEASLDQRTRQAFADNHTLNANGETAQDAAVLLAQYKTLETLYKQMVCTSVATRF